MKKKIIKLTLFSALFAFFALSFNSDSNASVIQGDPSVFCEGGRCICMTIGDKTWNSKCSEPIALNEIIK